MKLEYSEKFVAYLDVLGFKEMIKSKKYNDVDKYFTALNDEITRLRNMMKKVKLGF